jgi:alpha-tubulin suppressor-like RCC1 family protein
MSDAAPQELYGFGSNYFHALGGCEVVHLSGHNNNDDNNNDDDNNDKDDNHDKDNDNDNNNNNNDDSDSDAVQVRKLTETPWNTALTDIQCTTASTLFLTQAGKIYQVGTMHGVLKPTPQLVHVPYPLPVAYMAAGRHYCLAVLQGGAAVLSWGAGHFGQLGLGPNISVAQEPTIIQHLLPQATGSSIASVAAGSWHAAAITTEGRAFSWGSNRKSQCGAASPSTLVYPHPLEQPFLQISCGKAHSLGLTKDGKVYSWGASTACGHSSRKTTICPPRLVEALSKVSVTQVAAGESHSLALTGGGRVFGWGNNTEGQLGLGIPAHLVPRPKWISDLDFVAIVASGEYAKSRQGKDAADDASPSPPPTDRIMNTAAADEASLPPPPPLITDAKLPPPTASQILPLVPKVVSIAASGSYSLAVSSAGHVYGWGYNDAGVLGVRPATPTMPMIELPSSSVLKGRLLEIQSFDSQHNVLLPRRLDALSHLHVSIVAPGPCHLFLCGKPRSAVTKEVVGRTLYEMQHTAAAAAGEAHVMIEEEELWTENSPQPPEVVRSLPSGSPRRASSSSALRSQVRPQLQQQQQRRASTPPPTRPAPPRRAMSNLIRRIGGKAPEDRPSGAMAKAPSRARKLFSSAFGGK